MNEHFSTCYELNKKKKTISIQHFEVSSINERFAKKMQTENSSKKKIVSKHSLLNVSPSILFPTRALIFSSATIDANLTIFENWQIAGTY